MRNAGKWYPGGSRGNVNDGFFYNYWNAAWALVQGLNKSNGAVGAALQRALPRTLKPAFQVANDGVLQARQPPPGDPGPVPAADRRRRPERRAVTTSIAGYVPNVDQTFGGYFGPNKAAPGRNSPACVKRKLPWQGKIKVVKNGVITNQIIK